jgi:NADPH-dependent 2,4-dienoyl-CoA reductase/sulfur reductase-like enzyme
VLSGGPDHPLDRVRVADELDMDLRLGRRAIKLDASGHKLFLDDETSLQYDGLVIATGATPRLLPDSDRSNVHVLRTAEDAVRLRESLVPGIRVAVIGAGVLGCEIAATCRGLGLEVSLIDLFPAPMLRVVGPELAEVFTRLHAKRGVQLHLGRQVLGLRGDPAVDAVLLDGDEVVRTDVVVVSIGVVPDTDWLVGSGLELVDGLVCDEHCFARGAADRSVVAAGDVARWHHPLIGRDIRVEHWTNAVSQAQVAASNLVATVTGQAEPQPYAALPYAWSDQYDWKIQTIGVVGPQITVEEGSLDDRQFVVSYRDRGRLVGALCANWPNRLARWRKQITEAAS